MSDSPEGYEVTPQPPADKGKQIVHFEVPELFDHSELDKMRRSSISELIPKFLQMRVHDSSERAKSVSDEVLKNKNLYSDVPLSELQQPGYETYNEALALARFYWDNREDEMGNVLEVPSRVIKVADGEAPKLNDPNEKVLLYIDEDLVEGKNTRYHFEATRKRFGRKEIALTPPDIFLKKISDKAPSTVVSRSKDKWSTDTKTVMRTSLDKDFDIRGKERFEISGCQNLIIGGKIETNNIKIDTIDLSCIGTCVLLPGATLEGGNDWNRDSHNMKVSLRAPTGDIVMHPGSKITVDDIRCHNFIQNGGEVITQAPIEYFGRYEFNGGSRAYPEPVHIGTEGLEPEDDDQVKYANELGYAVDEVLSSTRKEIEGPPTNREPESVTVDTALPSVETVTSQVSTAVESERDLAEDADKDIREQPTAFAELQEMFENLKEPDTRIVRAEESGNVEIRGYDIASLETKKRTELVTYAVAAGWKLINSPEGMLIVQKKQNPNIPQA